jgi:hypothetical protein
MRPGLLIPAFLFLFTFTSFSQLNVTVKAHNKTGLTITALRISQNDAYNWSLPLNMVEKVKDSQTIEFKWKVDTNICKYDFQFTDDVGTNYILEDISICGKHEFDIIKPEEK